jgi:hypothetical protein
MLPTSDIVPEFPLLSHPHVCCSGRSLANLGCWRFHTACASSWRLVVQGCSRCCWRPAGCKALGPQSCQEAISQRAPATSTSINTSSVDRYASRGTSRRTPRHRCGSTPGGLHRMRLGAVCALQRCWTAQRGGRTLVAPWTTVVSSIYQGNMLSNHRFHDSMIAQNSLAPPSTSPLTPAAANRCLSCALREQPL